MIVTGLADVVVGGSTTVEKRAVDIPTNLGVAENRWLGMEKQEMHVGVTMSVRPSRACWSIMVLLEIVGLLVWHPFM
jgi:hypothetical protein